MRIAITGGTGFLGGHLAESLSREGHDVVVLARGHDERPFSSHVLALPGIQLITASIGDRAALRAAFEGCDAVAHCAGINREIGEQTYQKIHVEGTANVVAAASDAGVVRLSFVSFLRARPNCGSAYHESKFAAEEIVRSSRLDWTILKPGMIYGLGDHMLDHLSRALLTFPVFLGIGPRRVRPLAIGDVVTILRAALVEGELSHATVGVVGPTELRMDDAARLVADLLGKRRLFVRAPIGFHYLLAVVSELVMDVPLISRAQVFMLREGSSSPFARPISCQRTSYPRRHSTPRRSAPSCRRRMRSDSRTSVCVGVDPTSPQRLDA